MHDLGDNIIDILVLDTIYFNNKMKGLKSNLTLNKT